jgi:hypothetical protein
MVASATETCLSLINMQWNIFYQSTLVSLIYITINTALSDNKIAYFYQ